MRWWIALVLVACASSGQEERSFANMTAAQHRAAAERENRIADDEYAKARGDFTPHGPVGERPMASPADSWGFWERSWDPAYPEYYTLDPHPHVHGEKHADRARKHRALAEEHERAADRMEGIKVR